MIGCVPLRELERLLADVKIHLEAWKRQLQHECTQGSISPRLSSGAEAAENRAVATQAKWGAHKREGGYYWATYKVQLCLAPQTHGIDTLGRRCLAQDAVVRPLHMLVVIACCPWAYHVLSMRPKSCWEAVAVYLL